MRVIICGAGQVGYNIARVLSAEQNDVVVIEQDANVVGAISEMLDVRGVVGHGARPDVLQQAGAQDADMIIAVTYSDEVNMVACQVAHSVFSVPKKIARIRSKSYLDKENGGFFEHRNMPINVRISPEVEVARAVLRRLYVPGAFDSAEFFDGAVRLIGVRVEEDCPLINTQLRQLTRLFPDLQAVIVAYIRESRMIPASGEDELFPGDKVYFVAPVSHIERALMLFGHHEVTASHAVLLGGGNIGLEVASRLEETKSRIRTKLIELDRMRAEFCAERLQRTIVLNGDGLNPSLLKEANIGATDSFIALSSDDKANLLAGVLAKQMGCERAVALVNDPNLARLAQPMGIDAVIDPRATTVSSILQHIRRGRVRRLYSLMDGEAEMIEAQAMATSPLVGKPLSDIDWPVGVMFGMARSGETFYSLADEHILKPGDHVLLFALRDAVRKVEHMLRVDVEFFG